MNVYLFLLSCLISLLLQLIPIAEVQAQEWLKDRKRTEGHGIRFGDFELHPGLGTEGGYDTNIQYAESGAEEDSFLLRVSPHLFLSTLGSDRSGGSNRTPPAVHFRIGGASSFYHYFYNSDLDDLSVGADLNLIINPDRPVSFQILEEFTRSIRPFTEANPSEFNFARDRNKLGGLLQFASTSGLFKLGLGFDWDADWFEADLMDDKTSFTYAPLARASWQFLPMTALVYDFKIEMQDYTTDPSPMSFTLVTDNTRIASRIGLNGVVTARIALTAMIGYAAGFYDQYEEYDDIIGQVEARWRPSESFTFKLGYDRSFVSALMGNFSRRDRGYMNGLLLVGGTFLLDASVWAGLLKYGVPRIGSGDAFGIDGEVPREDVQVSANLSGEYRFVDWFALTASIGYLTNITDFEMDLSQTDFQLEPGETFGDPDPGKFQKLETWLGLRVFY